MNEYKLFIQRIGLVGITNILIALSSIILLPILTKNLTIQEYGTWVQITVIVGLIPAIATLGLPYTMVRFLAPIKKRKLIQEGFYSITFVVILASFIISLSLLLFSNQIAIALLNGNFTIAMILPLIVFIACLNYLIINFFRTFQEMKKYSLFSFIQNYLIVILATCFVLSGFGIFGATIGLLIANMVVFAIMALFIISKIGIKIPKFKNIKEYLDFGLPTVPGNLSYWVVDSSDRFIIGLLLGVAFVGYYSPAYSLGNIVQMLMVPFSITLFPLLSQYYDEKNIEKVRFYLKYSLKYFLILAIPSVFGLSLLSKSILMILTTHEIALNGYMITPFIALSILFYGIYGIISFIFILEKKTKITGSIWIVAAILNIILNVLFVPYFGIIGAALSTLIAYVLALCLTIFYSLKYFEFDFNLEYVMKIIIASVVMSLFIVKFYPAGILNILCVVVVSIIVYITVLFTLKCIKKEEIIFFRELIFK